MLYTSQHLISKLYEKEIKTTLCEEKTLWEKKQEFGLHVYYTILCVTKLLYMCKCVK